MTWPWVSRRAYELVVEERALLREQLSEARAQIARYINRDMGISDTPRPQYPPQAQRPAAIPPDLERLIGGFQSEALRVAIRDQCRMRYADGSNWDEITSEVNRQLGGEA